MKFEEYYNNLNYEIKEYFKILSPVFPKFLIPFIETDTMMRLKDIGYFCGMDYGSTEIYNFKFYLSTLDHSISTALIVWDKTFNEIKTIAALFHDAGSPTLRHTIDYLNNDHLLQESTEINLIEIFQKDKELMRLINVLKYDINDLTNFKNHPIVDSPRPRLCADRLDGIFLNSLVWSKNTNLEEVKELYDNVILTRNEDNNEELSFIDLNLADRTVELNDEINLMTQSKEDYYSMTYLAKIVKLLIDKSIIKYNDLYTLTDKDMFNTIHNTEDKEIKYFYDKFMNYDKNNNLIILPIKNRKINPLVLNMRYKDY